MPETMSNYPPVSTAYTYPEKEELKSRKRHKKNGYKYL
jgi:hypothetical protein